MSLIHVMHAYLLILTLLHGVGIWQVSLSAAAGICAHSALK